MGNIPDYANINSPVLTNGNRHYKVYDHTDSAGNTGKWHVYYDGSKVFIADPPSASVVPGSEVANVPAPAPVAAPTQPNGGVEAPAATPAPASTGGLGSPAMQHAPSNLPNWDAHPAASAQPASATPPADSPVPSISAGGSSAQPTTGSEVASSNHSPSQNDSNEITSGGNSLGGGGIVTTPFRSMAAPSQAMHSSFTSANASIDSSAPAGGSYTVAAGDNMWAIAEKHGMSLAQLQSLNPDIKNPELILPGQQINVGTAVVSAEGSPAPVADVAAVQFPTTSTYQTADPAAQQVADKPQGTGGWSDGTAAVPSDPTHGIASVAQVQTDPLKIQDGNKQPA